MNLGIALTSELEKDSLFDRDSDAEYDIEIAAQLKIRSDS